MALRAQMRKSPSGPSPEALLSQLSGYNHAETHGVEGGRSEASRILGKWSLFGLGDILPIVDTSLKGISCAFLLYSGFSKDFF